MVVEHHSLELQLLASHVRPLLQLLDLALPAILLEPIMGNEDGLFVAGFRVHVILVFRYHFEFSRAVFSLDLLGWRYVRLGERPGLGSFRVRESKEIIDLGTFVFILPVLEAEVVRVLHRREKGIKVVNQEVAGVGDAERVVIPKVAVVKRTIFAEERIILEICVFTFLLSKVLFMANELVVEETCVALKAAGLLELRVVGRPAATLWAELFSLVGLCVLICE